MHVLEAINEHLFTHLMNWQCHECVHLTPIPKNTAPKLLRPTKLTTGIGLDGISSFLFTRCSLIHWCVQFYSEYILMHTFHPRVLETSRYVCSSLNIIIPVFHPIVFVPSLLSHARVSYKTDRFTLDADFTGSLYHQIPECTHQFRSITFPKFLLPIRFCSPVFSCSQMRTIQLYLRRLRTAIRLLH